MTDTPDIAALVAELNRAPGWPTLAKAAASALTALSARVAELEAENARLTDETWPLDYWRRMHDEAQATAIQAQARADRAEAALAARMTVPLDTIADAVCAEKVAFYGEPSCRLVAAREDTTWDFAECGDDPPCRAIAAAALRALTGGPDAK